MHVINGECYVPGMPGFVKPHDKAPWLGIAQFTSLEPMPNGDFMSSAHGGSPHVCSHTLGTAGNLTLLVSCCCCCSAAVATVRPAMHSHRIALEGFYTVEQDMAADHVTCAREEAIKRCCTYRHAAAAFPPGDASASFSSQGTVLHLSIPRGHTGNN